MMPQTETALILPEMKDKHNIISMAAKGKKIATLDDEKRFAPEGGRKRVGALYLTNTGLGRSYLRRRNDLEASNSWEPRSYKEP